MSDRNGNIPTVLLVNGPPRSGKDSVGRILTEAFPGRVKVLKFANVLKDMVHRAFNVQGVEPGYFENVKDQTVFEFDGVTPRQAYIAFSERFVKPLLGTGYFGRILANQVQEVWSDRDVALIVVTDSGFRDEALELVNRFGSSTVRLLRLERPGYDFALDSRGYIDLSDYGVVGQTICASNLEQLDAELKEALSPLLRSIMPEGDPALSVLP